MYTDIKEIKELDVIIKKFVQGCSEDELIILGRYLFRQSENIKIIYFSARKQKES